MKSRRLTDLYIVGKDVTFNDGQGEPVTVYLRKINSLDQETALRRANAERSRVLAAVKDASSLVAASIEQAMEEYADKDAAVDKLTAEDLAVKTLEIEAEVASRDEWSKDNYLQGIRDGWANGLWKTYAENKEDPEAKPVYDAMQRYVDQVQVEMDKAEEDIRADYNGLSTDELREKIYDSLVKYEGNLAWVKEFRRCEIWFAVRETKDSKDRYFASRDEVDELDLQIFSELLTAYRDLTVEPIEGKSLPGTPASSPPSAPSAVPETEASSGLEVVTV